MFSASKQNPSFHITNDQSTITRDAISLPLGITNDLKILKSRGCGQTDIRECTVIMGQDFGASL